MHHEVGVGLLHLLPLKNHWSSTPTARSSEKEEGGSGVVDKVDKDWADVHICSRSTRNKFSSLAIAVHKELAVFTQSWITSSSRFIQSQATYTADSMPSLLTSSRCSPAVNPSHSWSDSIFTSFKGKSYYCIPLLLRH
ncbi:hypothetical protein E2C01_036196 [Portunus trituberculatus]|uniref:Uncharacterized protein n=1 Tax=Portunus trituberculatus TaxID=210409 RepID=A0A5B7FBU1_PORTR|nr:hypothetical protein [Portunus trituberculatus]